MAAINPFYNVRQSQRVSNFVDESIPAELMLRAGMAKQNQQDEIMNLVNQTGMFDANSIKGGDTDLINQTKERVNKFVDENSGKDLTNPQSQQQVYRFARELSQDKKIKQVEANYNKVQQMNATIAKLKAAGNQAFDPSIKQAQRDLQSYVASGKMGEDFGSLDIEKALNLEKKQQTYFDQMKANGDEYFSENIKALKNKDMFGKVSNLSISEKRIVDRARSVAKDYATTPEGEQALAIYREKVLSGEIDPNEKSGNEYLAERLIRTGDEFSFERNSKQAIIDPVKKSARNKPPTQEPQFNNIKDEGATRTLSSLNKEDLERKIEEAKTLKEKQKYQSKLDRGKNKFANSEEGGIAQKNIEETFKKLPQPTAEKFLKEGDVRGHVAENEAKRFNFITKPMFKSLSEKLPDIIKDEVVNKHNQELATAIREGAFLEVNEEGNGLKIAGSERVITWEDLNVPPEEAMKFFDSEKNIKGQENRTVLFQTIHDATELYSENILSNDASNDLENAVTSYNKGLKGMFEGSEQQINQTFRPSDPKLRSRMESDLASANPELFEILGTNNEVLEGKTTSDLLANEEGKSLSIRPSLDDRTIEVTATIKDENGKIKKETFLIKEKEGKRSETFDSIYEYSGDKYLDTEVGMQGRLRKYASNKPTSFSVFTRDGYEEANPPNLNPSLTIRLDDSKKNGYILGDNNGDFTHNDIIWKVQNLRDAAAKSGDENKKNSYEKILVKTYTEMLVNSAGFAPQEANNFAEALATRNENSISEGFLKKYNAALMEPFSTTRFTDLSDTALLMSTF